MSEFSVQHGMGEFYRVAAQIRLIERLKEDYDLACVNEFPPDPISCSYPGELNWLPVEYPFFPGELLFTWRAFPRRAKRMADLFPGDYLLLMGTNMINPGVIFQKVLWKEPEHYCMRKDLEAQLLSLKFRILESGFYDSPPWIDAPLPFNAHLKVSPGSSRMLEIFETLPGKCIRAHHVWALGERKI